MININKKCFKILSICIVLFFINSSCKKQNKLIYPSKTKNIQYSFSLPVNPKVNSSSCSYAVIYKNCIAIDTLCNIFEPHLIHDTSLLYLQVRSQELNDKTQIDEEKSSSIFYTSNLIYYDNENFNVLNPPLFNKYFSSFTYRNGYLVYWGFDNEKLYACSYNFFNNDFRKVLLLSEHFGGDVQIFDTPCFIEIENNFIGDGDQNYFYFNLENSMNSQWRIDTCFNKILPKPKCDVGGGEWQ